MLWVIITSASPRRGTSNEYPQHTFFCKKNVDTFFVEKSALSGDDIVTPYSILYLS